VCAPSGGNMQRWRFLVIRDAKIKETVGAYYKRAWDEQVAPRYRAGDPAPGMSRERFLRLLDAAEYLAAHIHEAPVWIVPCLEGGTPTRTSGSSIYPAVQNMLLAARALGLGATLTTLYLQFEKEVEAALGLPSGVHSYALLPIGYPMGRFGPVRRIALADVVYEDRRGPALPKSVATRSTLGHCRNGWQRSFPASVIATAPRFASGEKPMPKHDMPDTPPNTTDLFEIIRTRREADSRIASIATGSLRFREKYSFLTLHPVRLRSYNMVNNRPWA
jgi:nitroreductase